MRNGPQLTLPLVPHVIGSDSEGSAQLVSLTLEKFLCVQVKPQKTPHTMLKSGPDSERDCQGFCKLRWQTK